MESKNKRIDRLYNAMVFKFCKDCRGYAKPMCKLTGKFVARKYSCENFSSKK